MDRNQAIIDYLLQCPQIASNSLFFNAIEAKDQNKQIVTTANDKAAQKPYIDGSVLKIYTFTIVDFKSVTYQALVKIPGDQYKSENVSDMLDSQSIIDWVSEQELNHNYPDFGADCIVEKIEAATENPTLNGIDTSVTPALAKYSIAIRVYYMDYSRVIFK